MSTGYEINAITGKLDKVQTLTSLDLLYLRLDTFNRPLTGPLTITYDGVTLTFDISGNPQIYSSTANIQFSNNSLSAISNIITSGIDINGTLDVRDVNSEVQFFRDIVYPEGNDGNAVEVYRDGDLIYIYVNSAGNSNIHANHNLLLYADDAINLMDTSYIGSDIGESNTLLRHRGFITVPDAVKYVTWQLDADGYFKLTREDVTVLGFDIQMPTIVTSLDTPQVNFTGGPSVPYIKFEAGTTPDQLQIVGLANDIGVYLDDGYYFFVQQTGSRLLEVGDGYVTVLGITESNNFRSVVATGTQPYAAVSTTLNTNLNADLLDSQHGQYYVDIVNDTTPQLGGNLDGQSFDISTAGIFKVVGSYYDVLAPNSGWARGVRFRNYTDSATLGGFWAYGGNGTTLSTYIIGEAYNSTSRMAYNPTGESLNLYGVRPDIFFWCKEVSGAGVAYAIMEAHVENAVASDVKAGVVGVYANTGNPSGTVTTQYMYFDSRTTAAYNSATLKVDANDRVGIGLTSTIRPGTTLDVGGIITARNAIYLTQTDGNEYIDSLADGYTDIGATIAIRLNSALTRVTGDLWVGNNAAADPSIVFDGDTSDGQIKYMEDEGFFGVYAGMAVGDGGITDFLDIAPNGDVSFHGAAGFYPRYLDQNTIPAAGTGATQIDTNEMLVWHDHDGYGTFIVFNDPYEGVLSVQLT